MHTSLVTTSVEVHAPAPGCGVVCSPLRALSRLQPPIACGVGPVHVQLQRSTTFDVLYTALLPSTVP